MIRNLFFAYLALVAVYLLPLACAKDIPAPTADRSCDPPDCVLVQDSCRPPACYADPKPAGAP